MSKEEWTIKYKIKNLYLLKCGEYYKIGTSMNVPKRMVDLQVGNPIILEKYDASWCYYAEAWEFGLHRFFNKFRVHGEWFKLNDEQVKLVQKIMEYHGDAYDVRRFANA